MYPKELVDKGVGDIIRDSIDEHLVEFKEGDGDGNFKKLSNAVQKEFDNAISTDKSILRGMFGDKVKEAAELKKEIKILQEKKNEALTYLQTRENYLDEINRRLKLD